MILKNPTRNCECCLAQYGTGQEYGEYWCQTPKITDDIVQPPRGLCSFCNPASKRWYVPDMKCHRAKIEG